MMPYLTCFLILFGKMALGEENVEYFRTNKIKKGNIKPVHWNASSKKRINKSQIDEESFIAYKCEEEDASTAEFSLNPLLSAPEKMEALTTTQ